MTTEIRGLEESTTFDIEISPRTDQESSQVSHVTRLSTKTSVQASTVPKALQPPSVIEKSYHTMSLKWDPPSRLAESSKIKYYSIKYDRVDPENPEKPLTPGTEETVEAVTNEVTLKDLAAGGTYRVNVAVTTTDGMSMYSAAALFAIPMNKTELENFRDSLNLVAIEENISKLSSQPR